MFYIFLTLLLSTNEQRVLFYYINLFYFFPVMFKILIISQFSKNAKKI